MSSKVESGNLKSQKYDDPLIFKFVLAAELPVVQSELPLAQPDGLKLRKRAQAKKELDDLMADNAGKNERDRVTIWRKIEKYLARNDDIANE